MNRKLCENKAGISTRWLLWENLSFRSGDEDGRPHLQRQVSEVPLLDHILHGHPRPIRRVDERDELYPIIYTQTLEKVVLPRQAFGAELPNPLHLIPSEKLQQLCLFDAFDL